MTDSRENELLKLHAELIVHMKGFALGLVLKQRHKRLGNGPLSGIEQFSFVEK